MVLTITSNLLWNDQHGQKEPSLVFALSSELENEIETLHSNISNWSGVARFLEGFSVYEFMNLLTSGLALF